MPMFLFISCCRLCQIGRFVNIVRKTRTIGVFIWLLIWRFGQNWTPIWIIWTRPKPFVLLGFSTKPQFLIKKVEKFCKEVRENFFCETETLMFKV